jgi:hypothetical protein
VILLSALDTIVGTIQTSRAKATLGVTTWPGGVQTAVQSGRWAWPLTRQLTDIATDTGHTWGAYLYGPFLQYAAIVGRTATTFTIAGSGPIDTEKFGYLALKYTGTGTLTCGSINLAETSGEQSFTGFGDIPGAALLWILRENNGSIGATDWRHGLYIMSAAKSGGYTVGALADSNNVDVSHPMAVKSTANQDAIAMLDAGGGTVNIACTLTSLDADGITLNFSVPPIFVSSPTQFQGVEWMYFTILGASVPPPTATPRSQAWIED